MKQYILVLMFMLSMASVSTVHSMHQAPISNKASSAWDIILEKGVKWFDYIMINALAVSTDHDLILRRTAAYRQKYLTEQLKLKGNVEWHKYGAMCGSATHDLCPICLPHQDNSSHRLWDGLYMTRFYLDEDGPRWQPPTVYYSPFHSCLWPQQRPFFDDQSAFCFYSYGHCKIGPGQERTGHIMKYSSHSSHKPWRLNLGKAECMMNIQNEKSELINLKVLLEFPPLLNAFLKSSIVHQKPSNRDWDREIYTIEGVTIPDNYRDHKQYFSQPCYQSFDDLPMQIRIAVIRKHTAQRAEQVIPGKEKDKKMLNYFGK